MIHNTIFVIQYYIVKKTLKNLVGRACFFGVD